jgi:hypothetical protein
MKTKVLFIASLVAFAISTKADVPAAEKLLPKDTLVLITAPDFTKFRATLKESPQSELWNDPAMKPFKDKFISKFKSDLVAPLEKELGVKFSDYKGLAQGQFTFAVTQNGWEGKTNQLPGWIVLLDTKRKSDVLKTNLANLKKKWVDSGKQIKTEKLREIEFTTLITSTADIGDVFDKVFPSAKKASDEPKPPGKKLEILVGQSGSLLLVGNSAQVIEKVLVHQAGAVAPSLMEEGSYEASHNSMFRNSPFYMWINIKPFVDIFTRAASDSPSSGASENPLAPKPEKIVSSLGLGGLNTVALSYNNAAEGPSMQLFLGIPEASRQGLFKILAADKMESSPPGFVPADVTKFWRWRLNLPKAWSGLESMLTGISPAFGGVLDLVFESAGKDKDPNFDLKKELLANLGDDVISYQRMPANATIASLNSPPSIYLFGSPNAEKLAAALKVGMSAISPAPLEERDFLGRKIYKIPPAPNSSGKAAARTLNFAASGGYLALSTDVPLLEEYLRSAETKAKSLSETVGLKEAAEKVGGTGLGLFGFNNQSEEMRATLTALKKESASLSDLLKNPALGSKVADEENKINDWMDFSLLPDYASIAKYFHYAVYAGSFDGNGFTMKFFYPTPPQLKK